MTVNNNNFLNLFFLFFSTFILLIVYYLEFFLGIEPCRLCIYQRFPYFITILLAIFFLLIKNQNFKRIIFLLYIIIFSSSLILSVHHFGVENNWWNALTSCEAYTKNFSNSNNLKEYLLNKNYIACDEISFKFLGVSLAGYNVITSSLLLIIAIIGFREKINY